MCYFSFLKHLFATDDSPNCTAVNGLGGVISNPRQIENCSDSFGCYKSNTQLCWHITSQCKTIKVKFQKFIVEEYISQAHDQCNYDRVLVSWDGGIKG